MANEIVEFEQKSVEFFKRIKHEILDRNRCHTSGSAGSDDNFDDNECDESMDGA